MAAKNRQKVDRLSFLQGAKAAPRSFDLFALVRGLAARAQGKPPIGTSKIPSQDIVELRQIPHIHFPGPTIENIETKNDTAVIDGYWLGLTGPMSPLPSHLTEYAILEKSYAKKRPFNDFLHLLTGRFLQFFYRAWADSQSAVQADRPEDDKFSFFLGQLTGAPDGATPESAFSSWARLHYAGVFASRRSAGAIKGGLQHLLGMSVEINEFQPVWRNIEVEDQTRLGLQYHQLGDAILGSKTLQATDTFEAQIIPENLSSFKRLLPTGDLFAVAAEALTAMAPSHLEWKMTLCIPQSEIIPVRLDGKSGLGWSSWIGNSENQEIRSDVHIRRSAMHNI